MAIEATPDESTEVYRSYAWNHLKTKAKFNPEDSWQTLAEVKAAVNHIMTLPIPQMDTELTLTVLQMLITEGLVKQKIPEGAGPVLYSIVPDIDSLDQPVPTEPGPSTSGPSLAAVQGLPALAHITAGVSLMHQINPLFPIKNLMDYKLD